ncbi:MAG: Exocyst complex component 3 [Marteilia pararefringens]
MQVIAKKVQSLKDNSKIHQQLKSIIENFQPIFEFNSLINEAFSHLNKQRPDILQAHCIYLKLETARNTCLLEINKSLSDSSNQNSGNIIYNYFKNIIALYAKIETKLLHITQNIFEKIVEDPAMIVNCLRIIEREEKLDNYAQVQFEKFQFTTPNRPKKLKERFCQFIDSNIHSTLQEIMNSDAKLQAKAKAMLDLMYKNLRIAKYVMRDCFPPSYQILSHIYEIYHEKISSFFSREAIGAKEEDVVVILLTNIDYLSNKYLRNDDLKMKGIELKPLLSEQLVTKLSNRYTFSMPLSSSSFFYNFWRNTRFLKDAW